MAESGIRIRPTLEEIERQALAGGVYPVVAEVPADLLTPVAAYLRIAGGNGDSFLLESVEGGEHLARYSFLGKDPFLGFRARGRRIVLTGATGEETREGDPIRVLREVLERYRRPRIEGLPRFAGGAVGYFSYEAAGHLEPLPERAGEGVEWDDVRLGFFDTVLAFDHLRHRIRIFAHLHTGNGRAGLRREYGRARARIEAVAGRLTGPLPDSAGAGAPVCDGLRPDGTRTQFEAGVDRVREYIRAGDAYQVVLSRRFQGSLRGATFPLYRALRRVNPSPYLFYLVLGGSALIGASPEMLARVEDGVLQTRPIAGTRRRGRDGEEDDRFAAELAADPKERAEHIMLVDLGRNDVGRVCRPGSVEVTGFMGLERYSHVMHLVSAVRGRLREGIHPLDAFLACFPAGTVTGAPKRRAMEIIAELEPHRRGPYAGAVAYLDFGGTIDSCITIRTLVVRGGRAYLQVGAGIVADSDPEREYRETESKAAALQEVIRSAGGGP